MQDAFGGDTEIIPAARAQVAGKAGIGVTTEQHALDNLAYIVALIVGDFFEAQIAPSVPMVKKYAAEEIVASRMVGTAPRG